MASWETAMKVDPVAYATFGFYSEVFGLGEEGNIANQVASMGMLEDAPEGVEPSGWFGFIHWFWEFF